MLLPTIAIVGRPNVGKSTLFNQLTQTRDALVYNLPGVTRDRQYGEGCLGGKPFIVIDTGGLGGESIGVDAKMAEQAWLAVEEADIVLFILDAKDGLTALDEEIGNLLRRASKQVQVVVNKVDNTNPDAIQAEFSILGFASLHLISAAQGQGVRTLIEEVLQAYPEAEVAENESARIKVAIVGRPNAGKSTLINRILGYERVVTFDQAGTTRSSIYIDFDRDDKQYTLIDTAGVRRKSRVEETLEKFSVIKTLQAIEDSHVAILLIDAHTGLGDQDLKLLSFIIEAGKGVVIAINKWDGMSEYDRKILKMEMDKRLTFADFARVFFISALHGSGVGELYAAIDEAFASGQIDISTNALTELLNKAIEEHQPPAISGRRIKMRLAHLGGAHPPTIIIHGNQLDKLPFSYQRYLINFFRKHLKVVGSPLRLKLKTGDNPFKDKKNELTPRQAKKRKRMLTRK